MTSLGLAFLAGVLSILSPCVLPILPIVLGAAATEHRYGPLALAAGLALSFVALGLFLATAGFALGLDGSVVRAVAAAMMVAIGLALVVPPLGARLAVAAGPIGQWADRRFGQTSRAGLRGQFAVGLLLGAAWSPCVGPTLGAAALLAAEGRDLGRVALTMLTFGIGATLPLLAIGLASRDVVIRWRGRVLQAGGSAKAVLGAVLVLAGLLVLTGLDRRLETVLVDASPSWLTDLTTRF